MNIVYKAPEMANEIIYITKKKTPKTTVLKEIFERYVEDTITEEQVQRVLEPVIRMIREGKFDKPLRNHFWRTVKGLIWTNR